MRGVVRCDHCGAPHRREAANTRFRCDWCGGDNRIESRQVVEELLFAADDHSRDPATRVRETMGSRGLHEAALHPRGNRWHALWQVVNSAGEEFVAPASGTGSEEPCLRILPTGPMQSLSDPAPAWVSNLPVRPDPGEGTEQMIEAARASFDAPDEDIDLVRLVWVGVADFDLDYRGQHFSALQILGTDRVLTTTLPSPEPAVQANRERLLTFAGFIAGALLVGLAVGDPALRLMAETAWLSLGALYWWVRRDLGAWR